jgi:hypothetical protein
MHEDLQTRFPSYGGNEKMLSLSNLLHPALKGNILYIFGLYYITLQQLVIEEEGTPEEVDLDNPSMLEDSDDEEQMFINQCSLGMATQLTPNAESPIQREREINLYRATPNLPKTVDVLNFWKDNAKNYSLLVKVVRKYFCVHATSTSS